MKGKTTNQMTFLSLFLLFVLGSVQSYAQSEKNYLKFKTHKEMQDYFSYKNDGTILLSGHRGSKEPGYPENSMAAFKHVLSVHPAFFEIDPRMTKDGVIVIMHDATLDRTTTGKGKVADYTWEELQQFNLVDSEGNVTSYKIPTLEEAIEWSRGRTVLNLDKKDVPMERIVELIKKMKAEKHVMVTVHTGAQARYYYDRIPGIMMSAFARNDKEFNDMKISGVPWKAMIAYVGHSITDKNKHIVDELRSLGVRCMVSFAPNHDKLESQEERAKVYELEIAKEPDIIESDLPTEVWAVMTK